MKVSYKYIESVLGEVGLSASERAVYIAGLKEGQSPSAQLIADTGMPRPTVMAALRVLQDNGICEAVRKDGRSYSYRMLPPRHLKAAVGKQIRRLDEVMERLDGLQISTTAVNTQEALGQEAVQDMLELALRCKGRKWQIIAPRHNALSYMPESYKTYFKRVRTERQIESQSLWELSSKQQIPLKDVLMRKPRYIPPSLGQQIPSLMLAFDESLLIITMNSSSVPSAALITNSDATKTFQILFEMAWRSVKP